MTDAARADVSRRDSGSTLVLVLLLVVVAGLVVVPLMTYATSVLRLNTAVSERTKDVEASKAGLRVALTDPANIFTTCDDGGSLGTVDLNGTAVSTSCAELAEVGPLDALGFQVPIGAVAAQLGAEVPATAVGGTLQSAPVPSYPLTADWWSAHIPVSPDDPWDTVSGTAWMPELPRYPGDLRSDVPFDMPAGFDTATGIRCKVFFPGRYDQPLTLGDDTVSGAPVYYYFASGVYYFDQPITIHENADVVVGFGLQDFVDRPADQRSECADDLQVATSVVSGPSTFAIDGGGATWVLGEDARLIVDDSAGSPSIRFNQRYSEVDRGGRVSIMTVNGVKNGAVADPHDVPMVNLIPGSRELDTIDPENDISVAVPIDANLYVPSSATYTDAARPPSAPGVSIEGRWYRDGANDRGGLLITWDELRGNAGGGSLITDYQVVVSDGVGDVCDQPGDIVFTAGASGDPNTLSCYIAGLDEDEDYDVTVTATNAVGSGPPAIVSAETEDSGPYDDAPDAPTGITLDETDVDDVARVSWDPSTSPDDVPVTGYTATLSKLVGAAAHPDLPPRVFLGQDAYIELIGSAPIGYRIATVDPNGEDPTLLSLDLSDVPAGWSVVATSQIDLLITPPPTGAPTGVDPGVFFQVDYTITDQDGLSANKTLTVGWVSGYSSGVNPDPDAKTFDGYVSANSSAPSVFELPFTHEQGQAISVTSDTIGSLPVGWNATRTGNALSVWTSLTDGSTTPLTYTVTDIDGGTDSATITLIAPTGSTTPVVVDSCTVDAEPWFATSASCEIAAADLGAGETGFFATVVAHSAVGDSAESSPSATRAANFDGGGTASPALPERTVDAWTPEPIIDIRAGGAGAARVRIAGYVSIPMGRIRIDNPDGADVSDTIELVGGIVAGTYDLNADDDDTVIGFLNDIVLQRKVRITSTAGTATSIAVVQVNEDGAYAINSWVVD